MGNNKHYIISVGIPVYNVDKYIRKCVLSVLNQTFDGSFEIIVIDDQSPDNSIDIVRELKGTHPNGNRIKILTQPYNMGCWAARNRILQEAKGKYIFLLDADDYIVPNALETLYKYAEKYEAEAVYGSVVSVNEKGEHTTFSQGDMNLPFKVLIGKDQLALFANQNTHPTLYNFIWNVLLRNDFIKNNNLQFRETRFADDILFETDMQPLIERAVLLPNETYYYVLREGSLSNYQKRQRIDRAEIEQYINVYTYIKNQVRELKDKPYFETRCVKVMKYMFFIICGAIHNHDKITPKLTNTMINDAMKHPFELSELIKFKRYKSINIGFWLIGALPPVLSVWIIKAIGKWKHLI